jgi:hypothetical protein
MIIYLSLKIPYENIETNSMKLVIVNIGLYII